MPAVLVAVPLLTLAAALVGALSRPTAGSPGWGRADAAAQLASRLTGGAVFAAVLVAIAVAIDGPVTAVVDLGGSAGFGLHADRLGALLMLLVLGVSAVVQVYARRYLRADPAGPGFVLAAGLLTTASVVMVTAASLSLLVIAWVAVGVAVTMALGLYGHLPSARDGVRRTRRAFLIGDGALVLAAALVIGRWGDQDLRDLSAFGDELARDAGWAALVAGLVVIAALARSAQAPLPSWLPATLAAPTPVSALLHAGVVNAGGFLLIRLGPVFGASEVATYLAFTAGAATAVWGTLVMLAKPDIKGALAASTTSQMGFMIMTCGIGAYAAAVVHLVAHGMYKASLFLGSGGAVHAHIRHHRAPREPGALSPQERAMAWVAAIVGPGVALGLAAVVVGVAAGSSEAVLLLFAWVTGAAMVHGWLRRRGVDPVVLMSSAGVTLALAFAYVGFVHALAGWLQPSLAPASAAAVPGWAVVVVLAVFLGIAAVRAAPLDGRLGRLHQRLYVAALTGGQVRTRTRRRLAHLSSPPTTAPLTEARP